MNIEQIIGKATPDETALLLSACIDALPSEMLINVLSQKLTIEQLDELQARLP
jgi:hypothetical protein